jgi:excisionase family DNA binding protein
MSTVVEQARLLPLPEAATRLGVSVITLRRRIADGTISAVRIGPSARHPLRISESELARFIGSSSEGVSDDGLQEQEQLRRHDPAERRAPGKSTPAVEARAHGGEAA